MVVLVELVVLPPLVSPDHPPKRATATKMKQQHLCANCVTRKSWEGGVLSSVGSSGERICSNDGHASVVAAALQPAGLFILWLLVRQFGGGILGGDGRKMASGKWKIVPV